MGCAQIVLAPPWPSNSHKHRWLCKDCWERANTWIDELEYTLDNFDLPIDPTAQGITTGRRRGA